MYIKTRYLSLMSGLALLTIAACVTACKQGANAPVAEKSAAEQPPVLPAGPGAAPEMGSAPTQAAGIAWTVPTGWEAGPARQMRVATYRIHAIAGDPEDAECAVYFFGTGQGGTVDANLKRWAESVHVAGPPIGSLFRQNGDADNCRAEGFNPGRVRNLFGGWRDDVSTGSEEAQFHHARRHHRGSPGIGVLQAHRPCEHGGLTRE